jgi:uncharacterized damage-inducible protein DinB
MAAAKTAINTTTAIGDHILLSELLSRFGRIRKRCNQMADVSQRWIDLLETGDHFLEQEAL